MTVKEKSRRKRKSVFASRSEIFIASIVFGLLLFIGLFIVYRAAA